MCIQLVYIYIYIVYVCRYYVYVSTCVYIFGRYICITDVRLRYMYDMHDCTHEGNTRLHVNDY